MTEKKWIPIEIQKPEFDEPVLVVDQQVQLSIEIARLSAVTTITSRNGTSETCNWRVGYTSLDEYYDTPTHWMPLPDWPTNMEERE